MIDVVKTKTKTLKKFIFITKINITNIFGHYKNNKK